MRLSVAPRLTRPLPLALALALALAACSKDEPAAPAADQPAAPTATAPAQPSAEEAAAAAAAQAAAALAALSPEELRSKGGQALREQRLYAPAGDNAMEYYLALRKKSETPDASAESALIDLMPYAVIAAEQAIGREDFVEAERLRALIEQADPQAPALPRIQDSIAKGKVAAEQRVAEEAARAEREAREAELAEQRAREEAARAAAQPAQPAPAQPAPAQPQPTPAQPAPAQPQPAPAQPQPAPAQPAPAPARASSPVPVSTPQPAYPAEAYRAGESGEVTVQITIGRDGSVTDVRIVSARPRGTFDRTVQSTVRRWKFQPMETQATITRTFTFKP